MCFSGGWGLTELWVRPRSSRAALSHSLRCLATLSQSQLAIPAGVTPSPANHRPRQSGKGEGLIKRSDSDTLIHALMRSIDRGETWPVSHEHQWVLIEARRAGPSGSQCVRAGVSFPPSSLSPHLSLVCSVLHAADLCSVGWSPGDTRLSTLLLLRSEWRCVGSQRCKYVKIYNFTT